MNPNGNSQKQNAPSAPCPASIQANLKACADGELSGFLAWRVERHVARCKSCREEVSWLKRMGQDMRDIERAQPRPELRARILSNLPATPPTRSLAPRPLPAPPWRRGVPRMALASALLLSAIGGVFALRGDWSFKSNTRHDAEGAKDEAIAKAPHPKPNAAKPHGSREAVYAPPIIANDPDGINQTADRLFQEKMERLAREKAQETQKKRTPQPSRSQPVTATVRLTLKKEVEFSPALFERIQRMALQFGGGIQPDKETHSTETAVSAIVAPNANEITTPKNAKRYSVRMPAERVPEFFRETAMLGDLKQVTSRKQRPPSEYILNLRELHAATGEKPLPTALPDPQNILIIRPDSHGMVTLWLEIKPAEK